MVGPARSFKGSSAFTGQGFEVQFERADPGPLEILRQDAVLIRGASVEAVYRTTEQIKERIRDYIDAHFGGSEFHGNGRRRVSNASAQSTYYDDIESQGQYSGLVYSKFGKRDKGGFLDFLLLHVRGGALKPRRGKFLRLPVSDKAGDLSRAAAQTGFYSFSQSDIFFQKSPDGKKLYQLRRYRGSGSSGKRGKLELIATLMPQINFPARLSGIDEIARRRPDLFEKNFTEALERGSQSASGGTI